MEIDLKIDSGRVGYATIDFQHSQSPFFFDFQWIAMIGCSQGILFQWSDSLVLCSSEWWDSSSRSSTLEGYYRYKARLHGVMNGSLHNYIPCRLCHCSNPIIKLNGKMMRFEQSRGSSLVSDLSGTFRERLRYPLICLSCLWLIIGYFIPLIAPKAHFRRVVLCNSCLHDIVDWNSHFGGSDNGKNRGATPDRSIQGLGGDIRPQ